MRLNTYGETNPGGEYGGRVKRAKLELENDRQLEKYKSNTIDSEAIACEAEEHLVVKEQTLLKQSEAEIKSLNDRRKTENSMMAEISGAQAALKIKFNK